MDSEVWVSDDDDTTLALLSFLFSGTISSGTSGALCLFKEVMAITSTSREAMEGGMVWRWCKVWCAASMFTPTLPCFLKPIRIFSGADFELISGGRSLEPGGSSLKNVTGGLVLVGEAPVTVALRRIRFRGRGYSFQKRECAVELFGLLVEVEFESDPELALVKPSPGDFEGSASTSESNVSNEGPEVNCADNDAAVAEPSSTTVVEDAGGMLAL